MNQNTSSDYQALAATFQDIEKARDAAKALKSLGYGDVWIGIAKPSNTEHAGYASASSSENEVESDNWFQRVIGDGNETLHGALVRRGISELDADTAGKLGAYGAVVTVDGMNHPEEAAQVLSAHAGRLISSGYGATGKGTQGTHPLYDEQTDVVSEYGQFRSGEKLDETQRLQLREERLHVERERRSSSDAQIGKRVVDQREEIDVPVTHEELFIERRPVTDSVGKVGTIGDNSETLRIPLYEERLRIEKDTVATEEVIIGKRSVTEMQHVSETTRKEILDVDDQSNSESLVNGTQSSPKA